jgi:hypothetical protein
MFGNYFDNLGLTSEGFEELTNRLEQLVEDLFTNGLDEEDWEHFYQINDGLGFVGLDNDLTDIRQALLMYLNDKWRDVTKSVTDEI